MSEARQAVLSHDDWTLALRPDIGGAVVSLRHRSCAVLRECPPEPRTALDTACFPLVPYANRIAQGRFRYGGRAWQVALNFSPHPHALHGLGWQAAWDVAERRPDLIVLHHAHGGGRGWPWPYLAEQRIELDGDGVAFALQIENCAGEPMPCGLGFHPAFPLGDDSLLRATLGAVWLTDAECLPTARAAADHFVDWQPGARVRDDRLVDNCHEGWSRRLSVTTGRMRVNLNASPGLDWLHIYIPPGRGYFCAEPVSHMPDAINRAHSEPACGLRSLQPGECFGVAMRIEVAPVPTRATRGEVSRPGPLA